MAGATFDNTTKLIFGVADITFGGDNIGLQFEKAVFKAEPVFTDLTLMEFGTGPVDRRLTGWNVTVEAVMAEEDAYKMALPLKTDVKGSSDVAVGYSLRESAKTLVIHPRDAGESKAYDITIHLAAPSGTFERVYGLEQGSVALTFTAFPKEGAVAGEPGNYFRIGEENL